MVSKLSGPAASGYCRMPPDQAGLFIIRVFIYIASLHNLSNRNLASRPDPKESNKPLCRPPVGVGGELKLHVYFDQALCRGFG